MTDKPLKILFLGEPSSANTVNWTEGLRQFGCEVQIASARSDGNDGAWPIGSPKLPPRMRMLTGLNDVKKMIADFRPDILLGYRITSYGYMAARTGFHPLVLAAQNEQITYMDRPSVWRKAILTRFAKQAISQADLIHAWGHNIEQGLISFGAPAERILVLHRGVDTCCFNVDAVECKSFCTDSPVFISTRSLTHEYLIDNLIRAFADLLKTCPKASLVIVGDGPEKENLQELAKQLDISPQVLFKGRMPLSEVASELKHADFYISLIRTEGISGSLIEACACGVTPIVADIAASRELVQDGQDGLLLSSVEPDHVTDIMTKAIADTELRRRAFEHAATIRENYSREVNLKQFINAYRELLTR